MKFIKWRLFVKIFSVLCGPIRANMYIAYHEDSGHAIIIDPIDVDICKELLEGTSLSVCGIFLTHGHFDHAYDLQKIKAFTKAPAFIHELDAELLHFPERNASFMIGGVDLGECDKLICDESTINVGDFKVEVLHTPGHTKGSVCYLIEDHLFSGDTVFADGFGRYDLYGGDIDQLRDSLSRIQSIQERYTIHPGHGPSSDLFSVQSRLKRYRL